MQFGAPQFFWLLLAVPALMLFFWWARRAKQRLMTRFIQARLLPGLLAGVSAARQQLRVGLLLAAVALLVITLARPKWGFHLEEVKQRGLDIVVALDTSRSMLANDVVPNRLERAKLEAIALQQLCRADRLGLVAFAGSAFLQCPLSLDDDAFRQGLEALDVNTIPQGGTALAEAIRAARTAFKEKSENEKVLVLFSDGEDHDGQALEAAREAAQQGLRIFTIGVGTANGELLSAVDEQGRRSFLKDADGNVIKSKLNESLLQEIAAAARGFYLPLAGAKTMDTLYQRGLALLTRSESEARTVRQYHERFQWFLALAIVLLLFETLLPEMPMTSKLTRPGSKLGLGTAVLLALLSVAPARAASPGRALRAYQQGHYDKALSEYEKLAARRPEDARLRFNTGAAAYQEKEYNQALKEFGASLASPDVGLQEKAYYNLGNTHYRLGEDVSEPKEQKAHWQQAVSNYESALKLDAKDEDARHNLDWVKKKLEELQQQQQNQDKNQQDKDQQDKDQKDKDQKDKNQQEQNKDDQKNQQQQQQDQSKQDQQKPEDQKQQQDQQKQSQDQKQDPSQQQPSQGSDSKDQQKDSGQEQDVAQATKVTQMTPQQARQLLDAQRAEEKPMPFWRLLRTNRVERVFKNW
jgi:Ca-activated chloride channel homolog